MTEKCKDRLTAQLDQLAAINGPVLKIKRGDNQGPLLGAIFLWQETVKEAKERLESAWKAAVDADIIPDDDSLREKKGETIITESDQFSCVAEVEKPRKVFNRDKFIDAVAKKFKIDRARLDAIAVASPCTTDSKAPLSKRILEV